MLRRLYDAMMRLANHRLALLWLSVVAFVESSVFPIPPDVMLVPMALANPRRAWLYAFVATISSVAGGWLGYAIGYSLYEAFGRSVIAFYHLESQFAAFQAAFAHYGAWIVLIKGATPIPYKLVTISAGAAHLDPLVFTLASIASRAMRFFLVSALLWWYGEPIRVFVERRLTLVTTGFVVALLGGFAIIKFL